MKGRSLLEGRVFLEDTVGSKRWERLTEGKVQAQGKDEVKGRDNNLSWEKSYKRWTWKKREVG